MPNATLFDGKTAAGLAVRGAIAGRHLDLRTDDGAPIAAWALASLRRTDIDAPDDAATFRAAGRPERLTIHDPALLAQLHAAGIARVERSAWKGRSWAGVAAGIAAALALAAVLIDRIPDLLLPFVPHAMEHGWSAAIESTFEIGARPCTDAAGEAALGSLMDRLATAAGVGPTPYLTVLNTPLINAFTLPDGRILLLRGLIAKAEDPDELAGVLAHELGHVRRRDPTRGTLRGIELNMLGRSVGWGGDIAGQMAGLSYGRGAEAAADASALATLRRAHLRADGLARFFTLLRTSDGSDGLPAFLSNHPTTASRAAALQTDARGDSALDPDAWAAVRAMCR